MASQSNVCFKIFLIVVNLLFLLVGVAILAVGIYLCVNANLGKYNEVLAGLDTLRSVRYILIGCGAFILLLALCGIIGASKENRCLIILYLVFLVVILIANIAAIALSIKYNANVKSAFVEQVKTNLKSYYGNATDASVAFTKAVDSIQREAQCCGWTGRGTPNFFVSTPWYQQQQALGKPNNRFPESCCQEGVLGDSVKKAKCVQATNEAEAEARDEGLINEEDCSDKLIALNSYYMKAVLGMVILAILLQIICITCGIVIVRQISRGSAGRMV